MSYQIKLTQCGHNGETAEAIISKALGFTSALSHGTIIHLFSTTPHKGGVFKSKKNAKAVAKKIENRGAFGGFPVRVVAEVVEA